ncbi:hypothetical protein OJ997_04670 [Solirubrobacter phytolaccae]|uniref:Lipoprotein n=1 Tax=Solirubrobacter phytolaccae TaxID=1404360 RepID=A0A9X3N4P3_9ACTN|nr:hypothetical protein [Solirubrobacter phytolaccae]MDA0179579.1 hypothetical protein [Solirubrobacter phytolaccae]
MKRTILAALAVACLAAGCGSTAEKNDYVNSVNEAQTALTKSLSTVNPSGEPEQIATDLEQGGKVIDSAVADLEGITPPDDAEHAHARMIKGLTEIANTFRDGATAARDKDPTKMVEILGGIQTSAGVKELEAAQKELMASGYKFEES